MHQAGNHDLPLVPGYVLDRVLGEGGMGHVYLGTSPSGRAVAVKVIRAEVAGDPAFRSRFRQEVDAARQVSGAFTAPVIDADPDAPTPWMVTQYIAGPPLDQRVKAGPPLRAEELRQLAGGLAEALRDIHRAGIVHRDLKPSNVLLADDGPRVIDFGIVRAAEPHVRTQTGIVVGTPPFMSPEQIRAARDIGPASDVFSFGSVMVYAASGHAPFPASDLYTVAYQLVHDEPDLSDVPDWLRSVVVRCLAKDPAGRPTATELLALLPARAEPPQKRPEPDPQPQPPLYVPTDPVPPGPDTTLPGLRKRRVLVAIAAVVATATLTSAVLYGMLQDRSGGADGKGGSGSATVSAPVSASPSASATARPPGAGSYAATQSGGSAYTYAYADGADRRPKGWRAWSGAASKPLGRNSTCVYAQASLLCVGDATVRIDAATGKSLWTRASITAYGQNSPAVVGDTAIVNTGDAIRGLSLKTGEDLWSYRTSILTQRLTADGRNVYVAEHSGRVHAVDARSGTRRWTALPGSANTSQYPPSIRSFGGKVYLFSGKDPDDGGGPEDLLTVLDAGSGKHVAEYGLKPGCVMGSEALLTEGGRTVIYCVVTNSEETRTGVLRRVLGAGGASSTTWLGGSWGSGQVGAAELSVSRGRAYLAASDGADWSVVAVDTAKRTELWSAPVPGAQAVDTPPIHAGGRLYLAYNGGGASFDDSSGDRLWSHKPQAAGTDPWETSSDTEPLVAGGVIFLPEPQGGWMSLDATGQEKP